MPVPLSLNKIVLWFASLVLLLVALAGVSRADEMEYRIQAGDTLISLAARLLQNPDDWPRLQGLNEIDNPHGIPVGTVLRIPHEMLREPPVSARVVASEGQVLVDGVELLPDQSVRPGQSLLAVRDGSVVLRLPDGSELLLPGGSLLEINSLQDGEHQGETRLHLHEGRVESRVRGGPAARYRITTPTAVIGVRGTVFRVGLKEGETRAEVDQGRVSVSHRDPQLPGEFEVAAGEGMLVRADTPLVAPRRLLPPPPLAISKKDFVAERLRLPMPEMDGAVALRARIVRQGSGGPILREARLTSGEVWAPSLPEGHYRLLVRAQDGFGLEGAWAHWDFQINVPPSEAPPVLALPAAPIFSAPSWWTGHGWLLSWHSEPVWYYQYELLHYDSTGQPMVLRGELGGGNLYLPPGTAGGWLRVRGVNEQGWGAWSMPLPVGGRPLW